MHKLAEIIIISKYKNFKFAVFQIVALSLKGLNYGQQFLIVSFVPSLYRNDFPRKKGYEMLLIRFWG